MRRLRVLVVSLTGEKRMKVVKPECLIAKAIFVAWSVIGSWVVYADIPPRGEQECHEKQPGEKCRMDNGSGVCTKTMCGKLDYRNGTPPKSIKVPCVICQ
ncbi:hypothetical protein CCP4SC76_2740004 [Gammaproteobacteria bacterium]